MIRHTHQIGGVTVSFTMGHVNELRGVVPCPAAAPGAEVAASVPTTRFKIADWPSHERPDIWTWGDGVRLAESARAELGSSFLHGEPYV